MARYQIWDKTSVVYTPSGDMFTADQWLARFSWAKIPTVKMVINGGVINGGVAMEFEAMKNTYAKMGCDFSSCVTDQDYLDAIEYFEDHPVVTGESTAEERIAAAMEYQILNDMMNEEA